MRPRILVLPGSSNKIPMTILDRFKQITTFVFDLDGVLTDGGLFIFPDGQFVRRMNIKDGYALQLAVKKGYRVAVISGGYSEPVGTRLNKLGITDVYMQVVNKKEKLDQYMQQHSLGWNEILFMGDDIPDYEVLQYAGMPCCPADAAPEIRGAALYISPVPGGQGCVRDVIEKVLKLNNHWELYTDTRSR
jgi:3-deoxy-D-manno-octulosonate 8-phosphate phosphatase (KDO 8-P phosphatase)